MRKTITLLLAIMLNLTWVSAQSKGGKTIYSQMGDIVNEYTGYSSYNNPGPWGGSSASADDFTVTASGMQIYGASTIFNSNYFSGFQVYFYEDNAGKPSSTVIETFNIEVFEIEETGYQVFKYTFEFPYSVDLTVGTYWLSVVGQNSGGQWLTLANTATMGNPAKQKDISGFPMNYIDWTTKNDEGNGNGMYTNLAFSLLGPPDDNDLTLKSLISPESGELTATNPVTVEIQNVGLLTQTTFDVMYQVSKTVDGSLTEIANVTETVSGVSIAMKGLYEYTFTQTVDLSQLTTYSIKAAVMLSSDLNTENNYINADVINYGDLYIMGTDQVVTACDGLFVDDGSVLGNYTEASSGLITFYPENAGDRSTLNFTKTQIEGDVSIFNIYDGEDTNAPILYELVRNSGIMPAYVQARNSKGAITVQILVEWPWGIPGWEAEVACVTPNATDFTALSLMVGTELDFNYKGESVNVSAVVTNAGSETTSRKVYLLENNKIVDSLMTKSIAPGEIDSLFFNWIPALAANEVVVTAMIQNDPQDSNGDNSVETTVSVFKPGYLVESFESKTLPLAWVSKMGKSTIIESDYYSTHGMNVLKIAGIDTVVMPIMIPADGEMLILDAIPSYGFDLTILVSESMNGPWETVGVANGTGFDMVNYSFDLSAWKDAPHFFAFTHNDDSQWGQSIIDYVRGVKMYYYDNDLMALNLLTNSYAKTEVETAFVVNIKNIGTQNVLGTDYMVEFRTMDSVYTVIDGMDVMSMDVVSLTAPYIFEMTDTLSMYAQIVFDGEQRTDNNMTHAVNVIVLDAYSNGGETTTSTSSLLNLGTYNSVAEMIYYPSEVGLYGQLKGVEIKYNMEYDESEYEIPVLLYVGTTPDSLLVKAPDYWTPSWIDADSIDFTLVYKGTVDFIQGVDQTLYLPFSEAFNYDGKENLILMIMKDTLESVYKYPIFHAMDNDKPRFIYGNNPTERIDSSDIVVEWGGSVNSYLIPNFRFYFDNPGAPAFESTPEVMIAEGSMYTYDILISYESPMDFTVETVMAPEWLTITKVTSTTYKLSGVAQVGQYPITLVATDGVYSAVQRYTLTVGAVPVFTSEPVLSTAEGSTYSYTAEVSYSGDDVVVFTADTKPEWMTLTDNGDGTALLSGTPTAIGVYSVSITASGIYYSANQSYSIDVVVGVNDIIANNFTVYPNPAKQIITLANVENSTITIYDILGNMVKTKQMFSSVEKINIADLNKGVYMIVMTNGTGKSSQRLVIE